VDTKEQRERIFGIVHILALRAIEKPLDERQEFIKSEVEEIRREYAQQYEEESPITEELADKMQKWTGVMVTILEEAGGQIGHA
jgi:F0F1-type ATP synthase membrane subunit b/b'